MARGLVGAMLAAALGVGAAAGCAVTDPVEEATGQGESAIVPLGGACTANSQCGAGNLCASGVCTAWDCRLVSWAKDVYGWADKVPSPQTSVANTDSACRDWCSANSPHFGTSCLHNGNYVKNYTCALFRGGTDEATNMIANAWAADTDPAYVDTESVGDRNCMRYCYASGGLRMGDLCYRDGELIHATTEDQFMPAGANLPSLNEDDSGDPIPDGSQPQTLWDCAPRLRVTGSTFGSCANGSTTMSATSQALLTRKAQAYLAYIAGGDTVPADLQGSMWNNASRKTATRLCWLREGVAQGKVKVPRHFKNVTICGKKANLYKLHGTLAGINWTGKCDGVGPGNKNPAEQIAIINRTMRWEAGACADNDAAPTFFHASHYHSGGDSQALIDPEPASIATGFTTISTGSTAAATGVNSGTAGLTVFRHGSTYPARSGRGNWIGQYCVVGTGGSIGQVLNQVWMASPTNTNYLTCAPCGSSTQACCPNSDFATTGLATTCDNNNGLGCNTATGKCY